MYPRCPLAGIVQQAGFRETDVPLLKPEVSHVFVGQSPLPLEQSALLEVSPTGSPVKTNCNNGNKYRLVLYN